MGNSASGAGKGLTKRECERIQRRFAKLANGEQTMAIAALQSVPELSGNPFVPRLLEMFDEDGDGRVTVEELIRSLEYFTSLSSQEERYKFTFRVYNLNADGFVTKREVFEALKMLIGRSIPGAQLEQIAHRTVQMYDRDGDGKLSFQEFKALLHEDDVNKVTSL